MRKQLLVTALAILVLVAGTVTATTWVAQAVVGGLTATDAVAAPTVPEQSDSTAGPTDPVSPPPAMVPPVYIIHPLQAGEQLIADAQINEYYLAQSPSIMGDLANTMLAIHEGQIEVRCMAKKGWRYDPRYPVALTTGSAADLALNGSTGAGDAYRWQDAGCYGFAVHETGATS